MALPGFCRDVVTVVRPGSKTQRGTTVPDWENAARHDEQGCSLQPGATSTQVGERRVSAVQADATLYAPPTADIARGDRVEALGAAWDVQGVPIPRRSPTGAVSHLLVSLTLREG